MAWHGSRDHRRRRLWLTGFFLTTSGICTGAYAQSAPAPDQQAAPSDEIVVTAQKRAQPAQDVGIALNAFSGDQLKAQGVLTAPDIARLTPGVGISGSFAGQSVTFAIRGVTQQDFSLQAEAPVAVYIDDGYLAANNAAGVGLFDVDRVEVLKGPQGTLFGRNATGGLVNIVTKRPTDQLAVDATASYSSYNDVRLEAGIGAPLANGVDFRVAGLYERSDAWVKNISPTGGDLGGKETKAFRAHLQLSPSSNFKVLLTGYYSDVSQSWGPYFAISTRSIIKNGRPDSMVVDEPTLLGTPPSDPANLEVDANHAQSHGGYNKVGGGTLHATLDLDGWQFSYIADAKSTKYRLLLDDDAMSVNFIDTDTTAHVENDSQELRLYKDFGKARLTTGLYYLHIDAHGTDLQRLYAFGNVQVRNPIELVTKSYSAFLQGEVDIAPKLTLIGGFRGTRENKDYSYTTAVENLDGSPIAAGRSFQASTGQSLYSWKAEAEYRPAHGILLYGSYSRGTKAGSFNAPFAGGATPPDDEMAYKAEKLDAYEIGAKTTLAGGDITLNGSVFYYDYSNYQAYKFINFSTAVTNNPATEKGGEIEFRVKPYRGLEFMINGAYVDAKVKDVAVSNALAEGIYTRTPPFTSKWQLVGSTRYAFDVAQGELALQADVQYRSSFYFSLTNFGATKVNAYALVNGRISWTTPDRRWEFAVFAKNLTDKRYKTVGFDSSDAGGFTQTGYGEPRWIGGSIGFKL